MSEKYNIYFVLLKHPKQTDCLHHYITNRHIPIRYIMKDKTYTFVTGPDSTSTVERRPLNREVPSSIPTWGTELYKKLQKIAKFFL